MSVVYLVEKNAINNELERDYMALVLCLMTFIVIMII
jgi:hypothetical protein